VIPKEEHRESVTRYCRQLKDELSALNYGENKLRVELDEREMRGGEKVWGWVKKGVPIRLEIGPRDVDSDAAFMGRRDRPAKERETISRTDLISSVVSTLDEIHDSLLQRAISFREENTKTITSKDEFYSLFENEAEAGFVRCPWAGTAEMEKEIAAKTKVTIRCIPMDQEETGICPFTGTENATYAVFARSY